MFCVSVCQVWQHCDCMRLEAEVEHYLCELCDPRPVDRVCDLSVCVTLQFILPPWLCLEQPYALLSQHFKGHFKIKIFSVIREVLNFWKDFSFCLLCISFHCCNRKSQWCPNPAMPNQDPSIIYACCVMTYYCIRVCACVCLWKKKKWILLFSKDTSTWSKVTVKDSVAKDFYF